MGLLDDAIREHLELKRRHGGDPAEIAKLEREAFGGQRRGPEPLEVPDEAPAELEPEAIAEAAPPAEVEPVDPLLIEPEVDAPPADPVAGDLPWEDAAADYDEPEPRPEATPEPASRPEPVPPAAAAPAPEAEPEGEDLLEETPEFLEETPEHDRLWFEQRPPRDFDFDG